MKSKIFILGSNSFSGNAFADFCISRDHEVVGISRSEEPSDVLLKYKHNSNQDKFKFHQLDLNDDTDKIISLIGDVKPDYIVDYAGQGMVAQSWDNPEQWFQTNIMSKIKIHEAIRKFDFIKHYLRVSTPEVYGSTEGTITEEAPYAPSTPYAVTHSAIDLSLLSYFKHYKFPVSFTRSSNVFGPYQQLYRIIPRAIICAVLKQKLPLHGGGHSIRSFIHIDDVSSAIYDILHKPAAGQIYHVGTEEYVSIRELVERIAKIMDMPFDDLVEITEDRPAKDKAYYLDNSKIKKEFNWSPTYSLDQGITETITWVKENIDTISSLPHNYIHKK